VLKFGFIIDAEILIYLAIIFLDRLRFERHDSCVHSVYFYIRMRLKKFLYLLVLFIKCH